MTKQLTNLKLNLEEALKIIDINNSVKDLQTHEPLLDEEIDAIAFVIEFAKSKVETEPREAKEDEEPRIGLLYTNSDDEEIEVTDIVGDMIHYQGIC